ncbi:VOC family protein [Amycolatopsis alkalitolerans]|uniref:Glyoxalase n=1 Tax=Amycolatopsis alkalitolerans TaxID=2547244 RepID=A0A5C4M3M6_9PSEU|nr:VOC family protein [Amycolatopsis alkalitolerans]TNC26068.1 glyoxalase [Amycolatopsis alkalitolerans]
MSTLTGVHHLALTVTDVDRSVPWYERVLDLKEVARREDAETGIRKVVLCGRAEAFSVILVQHPDTELGDFDERRAGLDHVAFTVDSYAELKEWESRLVEYGVTHSPAKASRTLPGSAVVVFRDPDGIQLEVWADPTS